MRVSIEVCVANERLTRRWSGKSSPRELDSRGRTIIGYIGIDRWVSGILVVSIIACSWNSSGRALAATCTDIVERALRNHYSVPDLPFELPDPFPVEVPDYTHCTVPDLPFDLPDPFHVEVPDYTHCTVPDLPRHLPDPIHVDAPGVRVDIRFEDMELCGPNPVTIDWGDETLHVSSSFFDVFVDLPAHHDSIVWPSSTHDDVAAEIVTEGDTYLTKSEDLAAFPALAAGRVAGDGAYLTKSRDLAAFPVAEAASFDVGGGSPPAGDSTVPEPTSLIMWSGLGVMAILAGRRRRKQAHTGL